MTQPPADELQAIIDFIRRRGSVHDRLDVLPEEFNTWRLKLRRLARAGAVRISVIRRPEFVIVENKDYEPGEDEFHAVADVIQGVLMARR